MCKNNLFKCKIKMLEDYELFNLKKDEIYDAEINENNLMIKVDGNVFNIPETELLFEMC